MKKLVSAVLCVLLAFALMTTAYAEALYSYTRPSWAYLEESDDGFYSWGSDDGYSSIVLVVDESWGIPISSLSPDDIQYLKDYITDVAEYLIEDESLETSKTYVNSYGKKKFGVGGYDCFYVTTQTNFYGEFSGVIFYCNLYFFTSDEHVYVFVYSYFNLGEHGASDFEKTLNTFKINESPYLKTTEKTTEPTTKKPVPQTTASTEPEAATERKTRKEITFTIPDITDSDGDVQKIIEFPTVAPEEETIEPAEEIFDDIPTEEMTDIFEGITTEESQTDFSEMKEDLTKPLKNRAGRLTDKLKLLIIIILIILAMMIIAVIIILTVCARKKGKDSTYPQQGYQPNQQNGQMYQNEQPGQQYNSGWEDHNGEN